MTYIPKVILIFQLGIIMFITGCSKDSSAPNIDELVNQEKLKAELHRIRSDRENTSIQTLENGENGLPKVESIIQQIDFSSLSKEAKAQSEKERELMNKAFSTISKTALTDASISDEQKKQILDKAGDTLRSISEILATGTAKKITPLGRSNCQRPEMVKRLTWNWTLPVIEVRPAISW